jgi:hypothetical protein
MFTGLLEMESPVPLPAPTSLIGDGLQVAGWQIAYTEAAPGNDAVIAPPAPAVMSKGFVDS